jgi:putative adhesin
MSTATETTVDARFDVGEGAALELHNVAGRVTVRVHDERALVMQAKLHGPDSAVENTRIEREQSGDRVVIRTEQQREGGLSGLLHRNSLAAVDYDLAVPAGCLLEVHTVSADVDVRGTVANAALYTVSGSIDLTNARGDIRLHSVSGRITASELEGELNVNSTSGHVAVRNSRLRRFALHTVSGNMTIETPLTAGESYSVSTVSGNLRLSVPSGTGADVRLSTISGSIESTGSFHSSGGPGHRSVHGTIGDGGAQLSMNSVSGSLSLQTAESNGENR